MADLPRLTSKVLGYTHEGRAIIQNEDGSVSTERTITITHPGINNGLPTNIPSMYEGVERNEEEAIRRIMEAGGKDPETGTQLRGYPSIDAAVRAARKRSKELGFEMKQLRLQ